MQGWRGRRGTHLVITLRGSSKYHQTPLNRWREERGRGHATARQKPRMEMEVKMDIRVTSWTCPVEKNSEEKHKTFFLYDPPSKKPKGSDYQDLHLQMSETSPWRPPLITTHKYQANTPHSTPTTGCVHRNLQHGSVPLHLWKCVFWLQSNCESASLGHAPSSTNGYYYHHQRRNQHPTSNLL